MTANRPPATLSLDVRVFLDGLAELIAEDLLRKAEGKQPGLREPDEHTTDTTGPTC